MWRSLTFFVIFLKIFECHQRATTIQLLNYLNLYKLQDLYISGNVNYTTQGLFFEAKDSAHILRIGVDQCLLTMMFPVKNERHKRIGVFLGENCETNLMICINERSLLVFDGCNQIFSDQLTDLFVSFSEPQISVLPNSQDDEHVKFEIGSGFPINQKCDKILNQPTNYTTEQVELFYNPKAETIVETLQTPDQIIEPPADFDGCLIDNKLVKTGESHINNCQNCTCQRRDEVFCEVQQCPHTPCEHPIIRDGQCCPSCGKECIFEHRLTKHAHGEIFWPEDCYRCECWDGISTCSKKNITCPTPNCPAGDLIIDNKYQCCPKCKDNANFCELKPCHKYADCYNEKRGSKCICKEGFHGNGTFCSDIDECNFSEDARAQLGGCLDGTRCRNTLGSFECPCIPGYQRLTERMCMPLFRI